MPRRYWYVILTYILMQVSGLIVSLALITFTPDIYTEGVIYWTLISFVLALVIILKLMKPDMAMQRDNEAIGVGGMIIWSVVGVFMALFAQGLAVVIETKFLVCRQVQKTHNLSWKLQGRCRFLSSYRCCLRQFWKKSFSEKSFSVHYING